MIVWVKGVEGQNIRVKVLGSLEDKIRVQSLEDGIKFAAKLDNIFAIEFNDNLVVKFNFDGCLSSTALRLSAELNYWQIIGLPQEL